MFISKVDSKVDDYVDSLVETFSLETLKNHMRESIHDRLRELPQDDVMEEIDTFNAQNNK